MKRSSIVVTIILTLLVHVAAGQRRLVFDPNGGEFQISGDKVSGFEDFGRMYLETRRSSGRRVRPNGGVDFGQAQYAMRNIVFDGLQLNFDTNQISGISYRFFGRFSKLKRDEHGAIVGDNVLRGRFVKFAHGKRVAETILVFSFIYYSD